MPSRCSASTSRSRSLRRNLPTSRLSIASESKRRIGHPENASILLKTLSYPLYSVYSDIAKLTPLLLDLLLRPIPLVKADDWGLGFRRLSKPPTMAMGDMLERQNPEWAVDDATYWQNTGGMVRKRPVASVPSAVKPGVYHLQVVPCSEDNVSRLIEIAADATFFSLHETILAAFGWEVGDPWIFALQGHPRRPSIGIGPAGALHVGLDAKQTRIGQVSLKVGQRFAYTFDLSRWNEFTVTVSGIFPEQTRSKPKVVERIGRAPEQWPDS